MASLALFMNWVSSWPSPDGRPIDSSRWKPRGSTETVPLAPTRLPTPLRIAATSDGWAASAPVRSASVTVNS